MRIDVLDYYTKEDWLLMKQEADRHPTPFLVVNLNIIKPELRRSCWRIFRSPKSIML